MYVFLAHFQNPNTELIKNALQGGFTLLMSVSREKLLDVNEKKVIMILSIFKHRLSWHWHWRSLSDSTHPLKVSTEEN